LQGVFHAPPLHFRRTPLMRCVILPLFCYQRTI
jgi:hypothetical protein